MPGVFRMGVETMMAELEKLVPLGLKSVLLFAVTSMPKVGFMNNMLYLIRNRTTKFKLFSHQSA